MYAEDVLGKKLICVKQEHLSKLSYTFLPCHEREMKCKSRGNSTFSVHVFENSLGLYVSNIINVCTKEVSGKKTWYVLNKNVTSLQAITQFPEVFHGIREKIATECNKGNNSFFLSCVFNCHYCEHKQCANCMYKWRCW